MNPQIQSALAPFGVEAEEILGITIALSVAVAVIAAIVLALTVLWIQEPVRHKLNEAKESIASSVRTLMRIPLYARAVWGYCAHTAAIGAFAFWGPKFLSERFLPHFADVAVLTADAAQKASLAKANFIFGSVTVVAGALGTILGGWMCANSPIVRTPPMFSGGATGGSDCSGSYLFNFEDWVAGGQDPDLVLGAAVSCQFWFRDPPATFSSGLTDAVRFVLCQ